MLTQAYAAHDDSGRKVVVAFRGSSDAQEWARDLDAVLEPDKDVEGVHSAKVHAGFQGVGELLWAEVRVTHCH